MRAIMISSTFRALPAAGRRQRGLTLIELMVSLVIGMLIVVAMSAVFVGSTVSRREVALSADVVESGRYAIDTLSRELSQTGFYGALVTPTGSTTNADIMCIRGTANLPKWRDSLPYYVVGLRSSGGANTDADPSCITRKAGTDAIFIQRASTCTTVECPDDVAANYAHLQVSECGTEYSSTPFIVDQGSNTAAFTLQQINCDGTKSVQRKLLRRIFFIDANDNLKYQEVTLSGTLPDPVLIAENIEQLQVEYAVDSDGDGTPNSFSASPADWTQVIGVRLWILARSTDSSKNTNNASQFVLGGDTTVTVAAAATNPKRRAYSTYISFVTPKSRRES
jgi:type IV pilus assembly protein PilW